MEKIYYIPHNDLDKIKWDACIDASCNPLIYAKSYYLDAMSPGWDALILGNYEAVMPVTWRSKMGIKYVCQPAFIQQLGYFFTDASQEFLLPNFLQKMAAQFRLIEIFINHKNTREAHTLHHNFVLPIADSYEQVSKNYTNDLWKNLKRCQKFNMAYLATDDADLAIRIFREQYESRLGARPQDYDSFAHLTKYLLGQNKALVRQVTAPSGELLAIAVLLREYGRLYNMASTTLPNGRMMEANHFLFDQLIRECCNHGWLLDFEGSDQPGIARFYQKFGAIDEPYGFWKINRLPALLKWWKR